VVFPTKTVFIGARFTITEYPFFVCPADTESEGHSSFMFPQYENEGVEIMQNAAFKDFEQNKGAIPFRIRAELTPESKP